MSLKSLVYKTLNKVCSTDITYVLWRSGAVPQDSTGCTACDCRWLSAADLAGLRTDAEFQISDSFLDDFERGNFPGVVAYLDGHAAGLLFLAPGKVAARHNTAGGVFSGIALELPQGVYFLFKVIVKESFRGQGINAAMLDFAVSHPAQRPIQAIITTTDWTNSSFLNSVESVGFKRCAMASEIIVAGKHFYRLPRPFDPHSGKVMSPGAAEDGVSFFVEN